MPKNIETEITWETDPNTFINYATVREEANTLKVKIDDIQEETLPVLDTQINKGGLDLYSANINGVPIFHDKAVEVEQVLSKSCEEIQNILQSIKDEAKQHRLDELNKLETKIEEEKGKVEKRQEELQKESDNMFSGLTQYSDEWYKVLQSEPYYEIASEIASLSYKMNDLNAKLTTVQTLISNMDTEGE